VKFLPEIRFRARFTAWRFIRVDSVVSFVRLQFGDLGLSPTRGLIRCTCISSFRIQDQTILVSPLLSIISRGGITAIEITSRTPFRRYRFSETRLETKYDWTISLGIHARACICNYACFIISVCPKLYLFDLRGRCSYLFASTLLRIIYVYIVIILVVMILISICISRNNLLRREEYNILIFSYIRQEAIKEKPLNLNHEAGPFVMQMCFKYFNAVIYISTLHRAF
jgi:hypothetical protein